MEHGFAAASSRFGNERALPGRRTEDERDESEILAAAAVVKRDEGLYSAVEDTNGRMDSGGTGGAARAARSCRILCDC